MTEHGQPVCETITTSRARLKLCALPDYKNDDTAVAMKITTALDKTFEQARITDYQLRIFDAYDDIEDEENAHFRLNSRHGNSDNTTQHFRFRVPYTSSPNGTVIVEMDFPQSTLAKACHFLGEQVIFLYQELMDVHYGKDMPTEWGEITVVPTQ